MRNSTKITESSLAAGLLWQQFTDLDHEEMWAIFLTCDNGVIASEMLTKGTLDSTPIDARIILRHALLNNAAGIILLHNHPSGNALPSASDIKQTQKVKSACDLMGISLVDHLVMGYDSYYSFCDEKLSEYPNSNYQSNGTTQSH